MGRLCPVCFSRFVDYEGDELEDHIVEKHSHDEIARAYHHMQYYVGFLQMIARDHDISLYKGQRQ